MRLVEDHDAYKGLDGAHLDTTSIIMFSSCHYSAVSTTACAYREDIERMCMRVTIRVIQFGV